MGFERCHPAVNLLFFAIVMAATATFQHPVFLTVSFLCACAYSIHRNKRKAALFALCLIPCATVYALYYSSFHHFGMTVLRRNFIGNNMTLESLVYGFVLGITVSGICIWMSCVYSVFSTDKTVYLFSRISPRLSLFLAILLRMVPRIKKEAKKIHTAQLGIGRGINQGNLLQRIRNALRILSMLITWTIESLINSSGAMRSRGSSLRGRTAFSIYRFDHRDRAYVFVMFLCITLTVMAVILGYTDMAYDPLILWKPVTADAVLFYLGYAGLCLMPLGLDQWTDYCFRKSRRHL